MSPAPRPQRQEAPIPGSPVTQGTGDVADAPRELFYKRLVRVSVRHPYYAANHCVCRDFIARPSDYTVMLMRRMGLLFRGEDDGFSLLYNSFQMQGVFDYVRNTSVSRTEHRPWGRLCFELRLHNPWFVNFTDLRLDTRPGRQSLYFTNRLAHARDGGAATLAGTLLPVTGALLVEPVSQQVACVRVRSVSGREVMCEPRCVPSGGSTVAAPAASDPSIATDNGGCRERLFFPLGGLAEGKYQVESETYGGARSVREVLYTRTDPAPLLFVELLLADPDGDGAGVYPVISASVEAPEIAPAAYEIAFAARSTWWSYYVVGEPPRGERGEPRIRQRRAPGEPRVAFRGPCRVRLAGGRDAWRFVSRRPIPLARRPTLHLQLVWRREQGRRVDVLMERLPLADGRQLLQTNPAGAGVQALLPPDDDSQGPRGRRLLKWLSAGDPSPPGSPPRLFSDIYVNV
jgi:hypothetical protein